VIYLESRIDAFRNFVKKYPKIKDDVKNGIKTWQAFYEDWVMLGEEDSIWDIYRETNNTNDLGSKKIDDLLTTSNIKKYSKLVQEKMDEIDDQIDDDTPVYMRVE
jgi:uncharacterized membrane protein